MDRCGIKIGTKEVAFKFVFDSVFTSGQSATFVVELLDVEADEVLATLAFQKYDNSNAGTDTEHTLKVLNYDKTQTTQIGPKVTFSEHGFARIRLNFKEEVSSPKVTAGLHVEVTSDYWTSPLLPIAETETQEWVLGK